MTNFIALCGAKGRNEMEEHAEIIKSRIAYENGAGASAGYTAAKIDADYSLMEELDERLFAVAGQDFAVQAVKEYFFTLNGRENPTGVGGLLTFMGPPAVGKTLMAELIAKALHRPFLRLDMSSYNDHEATLCDLFGVHRSYKAARMGLLTAFVKENPVSVLLLDEFEKAHPNVQNRFLQILERGDAQDLYSEKFISFRDTIVILTSNLGREIYNRNFTAYNLSQTAQATLLHALKTETDPQTGMPYLSEAIVSRIASGRVILFNRLRPEVLFELTVRELEERERFFRERYGIGLNTDRAWLARMLILNQGANADVRTVLKSVREFYEKNIVRLIRIARKQGGAYFTSVRIEEDDSDMTESAREFFRSPNKARILVCCDDGQKELFRADGETEFVFADGELSPKEIADMDISLAIMERQREETLYKGQLFRTLIAGEECPVYVFDVHAETDAELYEYTDRGATGVFHAGKEQPLGQWIGGILCGVRLTFLTQMLFRTNRVVTFTPSYSLRKERGEAVLTLGGIDVEVAKEAGDLDAFVPARNLPNVKFDDVYGAEAAKTELRNVVDILKNYKKYRRMGIRIPRGILLGGAPGTGKTMLAKALAGESGFQIMEKNASEFLNKYVGEGARLVRECYAAAKKYAPCILFLDEADAIAKTRTADEQGGAYGVLNALLSEMDGFADASASPVLTVAATNFDIGRGTSDLDPAFLRRFDRKLQIELPDRAIRERYLSDRLSAVAGGVSARMVENLAKRSPGWSISELELVVQNAVRKAVCGGGELDDGALNEAFENYADGEKKRFDEAKLRQVAYHEAGHAVIAALHGLMPTYATVTARGNYGGYVYYGNEEMTELTKNEVLARIRILLGGRAAERVRFGAEGVTTGASDDLKRATDLVMKYLCEFGMDEAFPLRLDPETAKTLPEIAQKAVEMMKEQTHIAETLIEQNEDRVTRAAEALLGKNSLDETELREILS